MQAQASEVADPISVSVVWRASVLNQTPRKGSMCAQTCALAPSHMCTGTGLAPPASPVRCVRAYVSSCPRVTLCVRVCMCVFARVALHVYCRVEFGLTDACQQDKDGMTPLHKAVVQHNNKHRYTQTKKLQLLRSDSVQSLLHACVCNCVRERVSVCVCACACVCVRVQKYGAEEAVTLLIAVGESRQVFIQASPTKWERA